MKAAVYHGPGKIAIEEVPTPQIKDSEVLVKIEAAGLCGTDVKTYLRGHRYFEPPCILGHEFAGTVAQVGSEIKGFHEGDRVAVAPYVPCGTCIPCQDGMGELCTNRSGVSSGSFTEYIVVPQEVAEKGMVRLPDDVSFVEGTLAEPLACVINGLEDCGLSLGDTILILGAGPMGMLSAQVAPMMGASKVIVSEMNIERLAKVEYMGAIGFNPKQGDLGEFVKKQTAGEMPNAVLVCVGTEQAVHEAMNYAAPGGIVNIFGGLPKDSRLTIDPGLIHYAQVSLVGSFGFTHKQFRQALNLIQSRRIIVSSIVSHVLPLSEIKQALELAINQQALKIVLEPEG